MNLKNKIAANLSLLFSIFLGVVLIFIYTLFAKFRRDEFREILKDRISTTADFIQSNQKTNVEELNEINSSRAYSLQQEQILVFNKNFKLHYSNVIDKDVAWNLADLQQLKLTGETYRKEGYTEIYGEKIRNYYYLIQAEDFMGAKKIEYLRNLIMVAFLVSSAAVWLLSFRVARGMIAPLDDFQKRITRISVNNLNEKLPETDKKDEINLLAKVFNTMMERINLSYSAQKEFTASASHEIKTPLTRMSFQLENLSNLNQNEAAKKYITGIRNEVFQLSDTVDSLLTLSKIEENRASSFELVRMDEVVFDAYGKVKKNFPEFEMAFNINEGLEEGSLTVKGIRSLLEIVLVNLFKNATLYSTDHKVVVIITEVWGKLTVEVASTGEAIPEKERERIFEAFRRGSNSQNIQGSGLGLRISKRIMDYHKAGFSYRSKENSNVFTLEFQVER